MPQMAPMSWILLFLFFSIMLLMINMMNYYLFTPSINSKTLEKKVDLKKNNWMW
uniref:ATP synthase complex subunit 8 n=1 Tax=Acisoma panorpoides TaxID=342762 RepID=A0A4Y5SE01_ACIPA|nr:ATP synthase F0 subunit 8 [Acisoma panorpoides]QDA21649.1 ATP synthase F0 subunit 8 [Acisoma panorpoides]UKM30542.1 ATP synthase F0 subunit 8 [Acisoma panorpoides]